MYNIVRLGLILMFIAGVAAGGLALLNGQTAPIIEEYRRLQQAEARAEVMRSIDVAEFREVVTDDGFTYYEAIDTDGGIAGYVALAKGAGYSSTVQTVAGFTTDFKITGLKVTFQQETPGLGTKVSEVKKGDTEPWFLAQYKNLDAFNIAVVQDRGQIDAITGATITSRAVTNSVKEVAKKVQATVAEREAEMAAEVASDSLDVADEEVSQ